MAHDEDTVEEEKETDTEDPYSEKGRAGMRDDDEISSEEEGFMEGYDDAEEEGYKEGEEEKPEHESEEP